MENNQVLTLEDFTKQVINSINFTELYQKYRSSFRDNTLSTPIFISNEDQRITDPSLIQTPDFEASKPVISEEEAEKLIEQLKISSNVSTTTVKLGGIAIKIAAMFAASAL